VKGHPLTSVLFFIVCEGEQRGEQDARDSIQSEFEPNKKQKNQKKIAKMKTKTRIFSFKCNFWTPDKMTFPSL